MADRTAPRDTTTRRLELLERRLAAEGLDGREAALVPPASSDELSYGQRRLWFLHRLFPGESAHNVPAAVRIARPVDVGLLQRAFTEVTRRHGVLRARYPDVDGRPQQVIAPPEDLVIDVTDLASVPPAAREQHAMAAARQLAARPFDLTTGPLLRVALYRLAPTDHVLVVVMHHIVCDGASADVLIREISTLCLDLGEERPSSLPTLRRQYWAFARWQRELVESPRGASQLEYWRSQLAGVDDVPRLATDFPPRRERGAAGRLVRELDGALLSQLRALAVERRTTLFTVLLAAFQALVATHTGASEIVTATPVSGRSKEEFQNLIGFFINTLVLRGDLAGDPPFTEVVHRARETVLAALQNQDVPFELLVRELSPDRRSAGTPLFQVLFSFHSQTGAGAASSGLSFSPVALPAPMAKLDLTLYVTETRAGLRASFDYDTTRFARATVVRLADRYEGILRSVVARPSARLSQLRLLDADESCPAETPVPAGAADVGLDEAIRIRSTRAPHAEAVRYRGQTLTYSELLHAADAVRRVVVGEGVGPEQPVAVFLERSPRLLATLLGLRRAGVPYVPLDPGHPPARSAQVLEDSRAEVIVAERATVGRLPAGSRRVVVVDGAGRSQRHAFEPAEVGDLSYVIFTSGTTGRPQGVAVREEAVAAVVRAIAHEVRASEGDRMLALTTVTFDISVLELLVPLVTGGTVVLASDEDVGDPVALAALIARERVSILQATPSTLRMLVESGWEGRPGLRILCGGEALDLTLARQLTARADVVWNVYGPTETTIWSSIWRVPADPSRVSLGRPLPGERIVLLDRFGQPAPTGAPGELCIAGVGLARGYWHRPGPTAARFIPDRLGPPATRLYRTGDLARIGPDGELQFLGRIDHQLKIRGHRIDPGEVEGTLLSIDGVGHAAVVPHRPAAGEPSLAAFVVPTGKPVSTASLRQRLMHALPRYMVPSHLCLLAHLPLTPAGKVDRKALERMDVGPPAAPHRRVPQGRLEQQLASIWEQLLERPPSGVEADFFELGGHSLLAVRLVARISAELGVRLRVAEVFDSPTIAGLAEAIRDREISGGNGHDRNTPLPAVSPGAAPIRTPLTSSQERLWRLMRVAPAAPVLSVTLSTRVDAPIDPELLVAALGRVANRHPLMRTRFVDHDGMAVMAPALDERIGIDFYDLQYLSGGERPAALEVVASEHRRHVLDLGAEPPFAVGLARLAPDSHAVFITLHHMAFDAVSVEVFAEELESTYRSLAEGIEPALPPPRLSFADYAAWQRRAIEEGWLDGQLDFWRRTLAAPRAPISLGFELPAPPRASFEVDEVPFSVPQAVVAPVLALARDERASPFMGVMGLIAALLAETSGSRDVRVATLAANRALAGTERLIGLFSNIVVIRVLLGEDGSFRRDLRAVRRAVLDAFDNQELPHDVLLERLDSDESCDAAPFASVMVLWQHAPDLGEHSLVTPLTLDAGVPPRRVLPSAFPMTWRAALEPDGQLHGAVIYQRDRYRSTDMTAMVRRFEELFTEAGTEHRA